MQSQLLPWGGSQVCGVFVERLDDHDDRFRRERAIEEIVEGRR